MSTPELTPTSYAILGLLAVRPWTSYELAQQMDRSIRHFWPRAQSRIYEEPKRLVAVGLATAREEAVGRRKRTVYTITAAGRRALRRWLADPSDGRPVLEFQALLKVFFGEQGRRQDVLANIASIRQHAEEQEAANIAFARLYLDTGGPFPERLASIVVVGRFITDFTDMITRWSDWATETVERWPEPPRNAEPAWDTLEEIAARSRRAVRSRDDP